MKMVSPFTDENQFGNSVAQSVLDAFRRLPSHGKPIVRANGLKEWTTLAGIVAHNVEENTFECISLATGVKCNAVSKIDQAKLGCVLHDCHAEILALRGFNRVLLENIKNIKEGKPSNILIKKEKEDKFKCPKKMTFHLYVSECPCGDASMELLIKKSKDKEPWRLRNETPNQPLRGRADFSQLGIVRTKPGRADSPCSWSKSCSDKLSAREYLSLCNAQTSLLVQPIYLSTLVLPTEVVEESAIKRAFGATGRLAPLAEVCIPPYKFTPFQVLQCDVPFEYANTSNSSEKKVTSTNVQLWMGNVVQQREVIHNGIRSGVKATNFEKAMSLVCRRQLMHLLKAIQPALTNDANYANWKEENKERREAKRLLMSVMKGWMPNEGSDFVWD
ncbi:tRNA specific adenosine deaminase [Schizosaccharomyces japonicus yFS275]|uniref:tRNA specific adenosine deaminase n=1 Tax=Schizosaccharomyces japonicus (strain yFS275 / FY16936) TaxID=402676 RepID=B6K6P3_SCHJY|nr:tRNA specific adenosine deaminase [Schizosaccharomyces japonicus yFS275]EEB09197.2 tRNA specific adenosine deaminase [Schizosaccharomyces japonicus yFS275]